MRLSARVPRPHPEVAPGRLLAARLAETEILRSDAEDALEKAQHAHRPVSEVRTAYRAVTGVCQEPLPAAPAHDKTRPAAVTKQLSRLRTLRQVHLLDAPAGALVPNSVRVINRGALGPHVAGLDFDVEVAEPPASPPRSYGVDLTAALDRVSTPRRPGSKG